MFRVNIPRESYDALDDDGRARIAKTWTIEVREGVGARFGDVPGEPLSVHVHGVAANSSLEARQRVALRALHTHDQTPLPSDVVELAQILRAVAASRAARMT